MTPKITDSLLWCEANRRIVILDLATQRYRGLPRDLEETFRAVAGDDDVAPEQYRRLRAILPAPTVHVPNFHALKPPVDFPEARQDTMQTQNADGSTLDTAAAIAEQLKSALILRTVPFSRIVGRLASRRIRHSFGARQGNNYGGAISAFSRARRVLKSNDRCLMHSIAMSNYLAAKGYFPTLVIGVKTAPWGAHAWVQDDDRVLNDSVDHVAAYTRIMVV